MDKGYRENKCINCNNAFCDGTNCIIREQLGYALKLADIGLWEWDMLTDLITFSDEVKTIIGLKSAENNFTMDFLVNHIIHKESRESFNQSIDAAKDEGIVDQGTYAIELGGNPVVWVQIKGLIFNDALGNPTVIKGIVKDVTETHNMTLKLDGDLNYIETILEAIPNPLFYKNAEGRYKFFNTAFREYLGLTHDQIFDKTAYDIAPQELAQVYDQSDRTLMASKDKQVYEATVIYADGSLRPVEFVKATHVDETGQVLGLIGLMQDITNRKQEEARSLIVDRMKESIVQLNNNIINYMDEEEFFQDVLTKFQELFGRSQQSTILEINDDGLVHIRTSRGYDLEDINRFEIPIEETFIYRENDGKLDTACIINDLSRYLFTNVKSANGINPNSVLKSSLEIPIIIEDRVKYIFSMDSLDNHVFDDNDLFVGNYIRTQFQILYRVFSLYQSTLYMSRYDVMSGMMNRRYFDERLISAMREADEGGRTFYTVLFDLDGLKRINDVYGHPVGDQYIILFSTYLKENFGEIDSVGRVGGDEFICIVYDLSYEEIVGKIEWIRDGFISQTIPTDQGNISGSFSYGLEKYGSKTSLKELIKSADEQMYLYKQRNKG